MEDISSFFEAKSFAIIGATGNRDKLGWHIVDNFLSNFSGDIYFVNPKGGEIEGHTVYKSVVDIPGDVDAAVISNPAKFVQQVVDDCVSKKVKAVVIESGGFTEIGGEGIVMQESLRNSAKDTDTRLMGPNCIGVLSPEEGIDTIFIPQHRVGFPNWTKLP